MILDTQSFKAKLEILLKTYILFYLYKCLYMVYKFHIVTFVYKYTKCVQVGSSAKPLPEPMLTQIYVTIWHHWATMS